jgi:serine/threonine protein kinase
MFVTLDNGSKIECEDNFFSEGGEGQIYWDKAGTHVIKLYKNVEPTREATLREIVGARYNIALNEPYWKKMFAWPDAIIKYPRLGITMPRVQGADMLWFLFSKAREQYVIDHGIDKLGKWDNYVQMAIKMALVVARMHQRGLCHSDLSFKNFLCDPVTNSVVLLDCDSLVVPNMIPPKVLGTPLCMAPELMAQILGAPPVDPSWKTDLHALATLIYWLLLQRHPLMGPKQHSNDSNLSEALSLGSKALFIEDPNDPTNHYKDLPEQFTYANLLTPAVAELVKKAFVDGLHRPELRPTAMHWLQGLIRMKDSVIPCQDPQCPSNGAFVYHPTRPGAIRCTCGQRITDPPTIPIFTFYRPSRLRAEEGQYKPEQGYVMVGWPGRTFNSWHELTNSSSLQMDENPKACLDFDRSNGRWYLTNLDFTGLSIADETGNHEIQLGQVIELRHEMQLLLGPVVTDPITNEKKKPRLVYIQMKKNN